MFSLDHYSDFPQQQTFFANLHNSSPCTSFGDERINPFHHQIYLPNQMGIFLPQTLHQDPNIDITPTNNDHKSTSTNFPYNPSAPYEMPTCNQGSLGLLPSPKKGRHTKISTAHGFRDRRVRLSMAIAREFFDLQDMLGFDKASMTIGWLLAKSKNAIQELALPKHGSDLYRSNSISSGTLTRRRASSSCKSASASYSKEEIENQANSFVAKENRAKARARARERTREKLSTLTNPTQFDDLGFQTSGKTGCSSHFLTDFKAQDFSRSPHLIEQDRFGAPLQNVSGLNVIRSRHSSPSINLQNLLGDQDASIRVNHLPDLPFGGNYNPDQASATMFSGLEHPHISNW